MARLASSDPIEKFRFEVTFLSDPSFFTALNTATGADPMFSIGQGPQNFNPIGNDEFGRTGFSEAVLPKMNITEISYRENTHAPSPSKIPGMIRYDNLVLKRGVTYNKEMFDWLKKTNNVILGISAVAKALAEFAVIPTQSPNYRTDLILSAKNRQGNYVKHWFFYNCFVASYKPGDDFDATSDAKLLEEVSIAFEQMIESNKENIDDAIKDIDDQITQATLNASLVAVL